MFRFIRQRLLKLLLKQKMSNCSLLDIGVFFFCIDILAPQSTKYYQIWGKKVLSSVQAIKKKSQNTHVQDSFCPYYQTTTTLLFGDVHKY